MLPAGASAPRNKSSPSQTDPGSVLASGAIDARHAA